MNVEDHIFVRNPNYIFRKIVNEYVLVPIHQNVADMESIYTLNEVGALVWERLETAASFQELLSSVVNEYEVETETISHDLSKYLQELHACGAIVKVEL